MKKLSLVWFVTLAVHTGLTAAQVQEQSAQTLKAAAPATTSDVREYHASVLYQADYFFNHIPQANISTEIANEIRRVFGPLLELLSPIDPQQTQQQRRTQVMDHIFKFYGLLYLLTEEELLLQQRETQGTGKNTRLNNPTTVTPSLTKPLTPQDLAQSSSWQDHLKILIASSYDQEVSLLSKVHEHEKALFSYLPQFEMAYYQKSFEQVRKSTELTRLYLMLVDRMRSRFLQAINRTSNKDDWGTLLQTIDDLAASIKKSAPDTRDALSKSLIEQKNKLFALMQDFKKSDFYTLTMRFEDLDWSRTTPLQFTDPTGNPITYKEAITRGYDFGTFFHSQKEGDVSTLVATPNYALMFEPTPDNQSINFTALGELVFTGKIQYEPVHTHDGKTMMRASFQTEPVFDQLFKKTTSEDGITTVTPTLGYLELLSFLAMKLLHTDLAELFTIRQDATTSFDESDGGNLEITLQKMVPTALPNFLAKSPADFFLLYEINVLQNYFASQGIEGAVIVQGCSHVKNFFKTLGNKIVAGFKKAGNAIVRGFVDVGKAIWHGIKAVGEEVVAMYYATCILPALTGMSPSKAMKHAKEWQSKASKHFAQSTKDMMNTVNDVADTVKGLASVASTVITSSFALIDSKLGEDLNNLWSKVADGIINQFRDGADLFIEVNAATVQLTAQAVELASSVVAGVVATTMGQVGVWNSIGAEVVGMAKDVAAAALGYITLTIQQFTDGFKDAMTAVGYFVSAITDYIADIGAAVAMIGYYGWKDLKDGNFENDFDNIKGKINDHRRLISSIVTTAILIGVTVATGGAATPFAAGMLAVNVGMMSMNIAGAAQADAEAIDNKKRQHDFVQAYTEYVKNNIEVVKGFKTQETIEQLTQLQAETTNSDRRLIYYQNYLNELFNAEASKKALSSGISTYDTTLADSSTGVMKSDLGSLYGIQTGRMDMSGRGGFALYSQGRQTFSQEAALAPLLSPNALTANVIGSQETPQTLWFLQKDLANIPAGQPLKADVLWRSLYQQEGPFYIGLYLTERSFDIQTVQTLYENYSKAINPDNGEFIPQNFDAAWEKVDSLNRYLLDFDHLAKMFVVYRTDAPSEAGGQVAGSTPQLGLYHHELPEKTDIAHKEGWLKTNFTPITFSTNTWYRMQATLDGTKLSVAFWQVGTDAQAAAARKEDLPPSSALTTTVSVAPATIPESVASLLLNQDKYKGSMGVITAGAAVEYKVLAPTTVALSTSKGVVELSAPQLTPQRTAVEKSQGGTTEKEREKAWHASAQVQEKAQRAAQTATLEQTAQTALESLKSGVTLVTTQISLATDSLKPQLQAAVTKGQQATQTLEQTLTTYRASTQRTPEQQEALKTVIDKARTTTQELQKVIDTAQQALIGQATLYGSQQADASYNDYYNYGVDSGGF